MIIDKAQLLFLSIILSIIDKFYEHYSIVAIIGKNKHNRLVPSFMLHTYVVMNTYGLTDD